MATDVKLNRDGVEDIVREKYGQRAAEVMRGEKTPWAGASSCCG